VVNITDKQKDYAEEVAASLKSQGFRVLTDLRNEKVGFKIREAELSKLPFVLVVGEKERESGAVAVRGRHGADLGVMSVAEFGAHLQVEVENKSAITHQA
jgi:threonyl-tRNA synthetase